MDNHSEDDVLKILTEFWGRRNQFIQPEFPENELVIGPYPLNVNLFGAGFVPAFPKLIAIVVSASGDRTRSDGGYIQLPSGNYTIYYVDCRERYLTLPEVRTVSADGANVALTLGITYSVHDPLAIQTLRNPVTALLTGCEAALRDLIHTHRHDQLVGKPDDPQVIQNAAITEAVKTQIGQNEALQGFTLINVNVIERQGHTPLINIREARVVQQQDSEREIESTHLQTQIVGEQRALIDKQGDNTLLQANIETHREQILFAARKLSVELENMKRRPDFILKDFETHGKALEALIQALAMPGFPRNDEDRHFIDKVLNGLPEISSLMGPEMLGHESHVDELSSDLIHLMIPKKK